MSAPPLLYHGTSRKAATAILKLGFRRAGRPSYTGTAVNLSESITVAAEYGPYDGGGCVLAVRLAATVRWLDDPKINPGKGDPDGFFQESGLDALRTYSGNVWLLWNTAMAAEIRMLTVAEAVDALVAEFRENGPEVGYNGDVQDYADCFFALSAGQPAPHDADPRIVARVKRSLARPATFARESATHELLAA